MRTKIIKLDPLAPDERSINEIASALAKGQIVCIPTETVYGMAFDADNKNALKRLLKIRNSPDDKNISFWVAKTEDMVKFVKNPPLPAKKLASVFWPGPLTIVIRNARGKTIGLRCPSHPVSASIIQSSRCLIGAPSANLSGMPPAVSFDEVFKNFDGIVDVIVDGGNSKFGISSTVVQITDNKLEFLREGAVPRQLITDILPVRIMFVCTGNTCRSPIAEALFKLMFSGNAETPSPAVEEPVYKADSAGLMAIDGEQVSRHASAILAENGYDLTPHLSKLLTKKKVEGADMIFTMTASHLHTLTNKFPEFIHKFQTLSPDGADISDPFGGTIEQYRKVFNQIKRSLMQRFKEL